MLDHRSRITSAEPPGLMPAIAAQLRQELRDYSVELRQLAYTVPDGAGEHDFLRLSGRMRDIADRVDVSGSVDDG